MSGSFIIQENTFLIKKSALDGFDVLASIDRGGSLTKLLYMTESEQTDCYNMHAILFHNKDFEAALRFLAEQDFVKLGDRKAIKTTGVGCAKYEDLIKEIVGLQLQFVDEFITIFTGIHFLLCNMKLDDICYSEEEDKIDLTLFEQKSDNPEAKNLSQQWQVEEKDAADAQPDKFLPCLYGVMGSAGGFSQILADGRCRLVSGVGMAGKAFLGYAKLLLGTSDYDEVLRLAGEGKRGNVDNEARDLLVTDADTPYGRMPPSMPIFPFGKVVDKELKRSQCSREDLAASLVAAFAANLFNFSCTCAKVTGCPRILFGGNFFRHPVMRAELLRQKHFFEMHSLSIRFLRAGYAGAVGAVVGSQNDMARVLFD